MATPKKTTTRKSTTAEKPSVAPKAAPKAAPAPLAATQVIKPAPAAATKPTVPVAIPPTGTKPATAPIRTITQSQWRSMVEEAAYYRAERSGFSGDPQDHWASAEKEIRDRLTRESVKIV